MRTVTATLTALSLTLSPTSWLLSDEARGYTYHVDGYGEVTVKGVCAVTADSVACWLPDGTPDSHLTSEVDARLREDSNAVLRVRFHQRNLLLVTEQPPTTAGFAQPVFVGRYARSRPETVYLRNLVRTVNMLSLLPVPVEEKRTDIGMSIPIPVDSARVPFKSGSKVTIGDATFVLGGLHHMTNQGPVQTSVAPPPEWVVDYQVDGVAAAAALRLGPVLLGKDGKPLKTDTSRELRTIRGYHGPFRYNVFDQPLAFTSIVKWQLNCDPKEIGFIELHPSYQRQVTFRDVALEPR